MIDRTLVVKGPCAIKHVCDGTTLTIFTKDDVKAKVEIMTKAIKSSAFGNMDKIVVGRKISFDCVPIGCFSAANAAILWPYGSTPIGSSIINPTTASKTTERSVEVYGAEGSKLVIHAAYIKKMPSMKLTSQDTLFGSMTFASVGKKATAWTEANSLYTYTASGITFPTEFSSDNIITTPYTAAWGSVAGFTSIDTVDGFDIDFGMSSSEITSDSMGIVDDILEDITVTVKCKPLGPTIDQILAAMKLQGTGGLTMGSRIGAQQAANLVITGEADGSPIVTVTKAGLETQDLDYGMNSFRNGEATWTATRTLSAGVAAPLFTIGAVA